MSCVEKDRSSSDETSLASILSSVISDVATVDNSDSTAAATLELVQTNITKLERLAEAVGKLALFSDNEDIDELPTESLRFLLVPTLLGWFTDKTIDDLTRLETLERAEAFIKVYLQQLECYGIAPASSKHTVSETQKRQNKIMMYKEKKELESKLDILRQRMNGKQAVDDELRRELYLTELKLWSKISAEELDAIEKEKCMLRLRQDPNAVSSSRQDVTRKPLTPMIITRTELQKHVFGMGYPSLPTMTVEEFFQQPRFQQAAAAPPPPPPMTEEEEKIMREKDLEAENPDAIQYMRDYDEYKDDHRRGWGNTHNKG